MPERTGWGAPQNWGLLVPGRGGLGRPTLGARLQCPVPTKRTHPSLSSRGLARPDGPGSVKVGRREWKRRETQGGPFRTGQGAGQASRPPHHAVGARRSSAWGRRAGRGPGAPAAAAPPPAHPEGEAARARPLFLRAALPAAPALAPCLEGATLTSEPLPRAARPLGAADSAQRSPAERRGAAPSPAGRLAEPPGAPGPATPAPSSAGPGGRARWWGNRPECPGHPVHVDPCPFSAVPSSEGFGASLKKALPSSPNVSEASLPRAFCIGGHG
ncbi:neuroblastoma suppressor of tumorigenicity 1 isoform X2 [Pongo abelii]|uniref:neuroblastoma suppressor of tumorigenicity 1 isoform X2 n=1 Tax=Pongo abelii TaxID=9601 RepID=UPI00300477BA